MCLAQTLEELPARELADITALEIMDWRDPTNPSIWIVPLEQYEALNGREWNPVIFGDHVDLLVKTVSGHQCADYFRETMTEIIGAPFKQFPGESIARSRVNVFDLILATPRQKTIACILAVRKWRL